MRRKQNNGKLTITVYEDISGEIDWHAGPAGSFDDDVGSVADVEVLFEIKVVGKIIGEPITGRGAPLDRDEDEEEDEE